MKQLKQIYVATLTNSYNNLEKSMYQLWQIHVTTEKNPFTNFDKLMYYLKEIPLPILTILCNILEKSINPNTTIWIQTRAQRDWLRDKALQWSDLGLIKKTTKSDAWILRDTDHRIHEGFNLFSITPKTIAWGIWFTLTRYRKISRGIELFHKE